MLLSIFLVVLHGSSGEANNNMDRVSLVSCILRGEELFSVAFKPILISFAISEQDPEDNTYITSSSLLLDGLSVSMKWTVVVANVNKGNIIIPKHGRANTIFNYIIFFRQSTELVEILQALRRMQVLNPHARFLIVSSTKFNFVNPVIKEIFRSLHSYHVLNAVLLIGDPSSEFSFNVFKLMPFWNNTCNPNIDKDVAEIDSCTNGTFLLESEWYNEEIPKTFQSCELKVAYAEWPPYAVDMDNISTLAPSEFLEHGIDVGMVANIFAYMNVSLMFIKTEGIGEIYPNSTATGPFRSLYDHQADIAVGGISQTLLRMVVFDCSFTYKVEELVWVVPHEHLVLTELVGLASIIKFNVWIGIAALCSTTTAIILMFAKKSEVERKMFKSPSNTVQSMLLATVNLPSGMLPKIHETRLIFSMVLLFALIFNAAYTTYLTSVLTKADLYREKYANVTDIQDNNLKVYISPNADRFFQKNDTLDYKLVQTATTCPITSYSRCLGDVAIHKNATILAPKGFVEYIKNSYISTSNSYLLHLLKPVVSYQLNIVMVKGFWGYERVNTLLNNAMASGLAAKWMTVPKNNNNFISKVVVESELSKGSNTLNFKTLQFVFYLLVAGDMVAIVVFCVELVAFRHFNKVSKS